MDSRPPPPIAVDIPSDDDEDDASTSPRPPRSKKRMAMDHVGGGGPPLLVLVDDDPTPQKKPHPDRTPSFVPDTPMTPSDSAFDSGASIVRCSLARSSQHEGARRPSDKFFGITGLICLESDNELESEGGSHRGNPKASASVAGNNGERISNGTRSRSFDICRSSSGSLPSPGNVFDVGFKAEENDASFGKNGGLAFSGATNFVQTVGDSPPPRGGGSDTGCFDEDDIIPQSQVQSDPGNVENVMLEHVDSTTKHRGKTVAVNAEKRSRKEEQLARKKQLKEEKVHLNEERKRKRQEEKLAKEALKAEAAEMKKLQKEKQKWEKGKFASKSIVAEIDAKVVENGSVGGHLLTRLAEKGLSFRITSNPFERSIVWKMSVPDEISQLSPVRSEVPYVLLVYEADEFCNLATNGSLLDHVSRVQSRYPSFTICFLTNKLMSYINKREQSQYKNPSNVNCWRRPPVEEVLSKLTTHFTRVHSRQCIDEADIADHVVGLTSSLATCQFRKKLTWLSVNANGSLIPKDFIDKHLIKKSVWLKALIAIPKVQPRFAIAIWKKYPTMRSLLNVYLDPNKSVHEKEFLLKDLTIEGFLGKEDRRLGQVCSKRVYRILMAQTGGIKTDDVEDGADFFGS